MRPEWEEVAGEVKRLKVFGGWIVKDKHNIFGTLILAGWTTMCFVPDPKHEWRLE